MDIDVYEVVKKLIGEVDPAGETQTDNVRFENLKVMTVLVDKLLTDIDDLWHENKNSHEFSVKRASEFAGKFLDKIGIKEDEGGEIPPFLFS